jgi:hypothetical protein
VSIGAIRRFTSWLVTSRKANLPAGACARLAGLWATRTRDIREKSISIGQREYNPRLLIIYHHQTFTLYHLVFAEQNSEPRVIWRPSSGLPQDRYWQRYPAQMLEMPSSAVKQGLPLPPGSHSLMGREQLPLQQSTSLPQKPGEGAHCGGCARTIGGIAYCVNAPHLASARRSA